MSPAIERLGGRLAVRLGLTGSLGPAYASSVSRRPAGLAALPVPATKCCWRCQRRLFSITGVVAGSSSSRWTSRQEKDIYAREAKVRGLKGRAAFKLLEMDSKYRLFRPGQMVVDLGYAPGSWSQVALERTKPTGRVLGIDLIPAQPPRGVSTIQGNFLAPSVRALVKEYLATSKKRPIARNRESKSDPDARAPDDFEEATDIVLDRPSYLQIGQEEALTSALPLTGEDVAPVQDSIDSSRTVDVVLSDMMMNTSGTPFRDHAGSMDLCAAALEFASDTLRPGGHFVCKFYQGGEDKALETRLLKMFAKVHREKPNSSRSESKESFFVALRRKGNVKWEDLQ
ncbi:cell division protein [Grosmannia clavigera kw1407]|uniref:rRNA methyltransferase 2, mitochondrial n=1 Tax=Grosmannia clavigera (strain kw1407 / UAMH 11150) TaxID=655863 RepID=F0XSH8_GROCL|nr:cell division protein [Grosmannia clavigera kw1407]EFW99289.1 cell division protein [Grosmannia clavigera kw1407]